MRKVLVSNLISLDGFIAGPKGEIDWFVNIADKEFENYAVGLIDAVDTMLFGRVTYELMAGYWPTATTATDDQRIIDAMNSSQKIVFSKTLSKVTWKNARLATKDIAEEVSDLKKSPGRDIVIYGSGSIVSALTRSGLIDEYRILVCPFILGSGIPHFDGVRERVSLKLVDSRKFSSGVVALDYLPVRGGVA